jgi:hypothetical protein
LSRRCACANTVRKAGRTRGVGQANARPHDVPQATRKCTAACCNPCGASSQEGLLAGVLMEMVSSCVRCAALLEWEWYSSDAIRGVRELCS